MNALTIHGLTSEELIGEARKGFRAKVKQVIGLEGKMVAVRTAASYFGLTESQGRRIYDGNLKGIDALPYVKITRWYDALIEAEARKRESRQAIALAKHGRFNDAVDQKSSTRGSGGVVLRSSRLRE